jgi:hypothetical protein
MINGVSQRHAFYGAVFRGGRKEVERPFNKRYVKPVDMVSEKLKFYASPAVRCVRNNAIGILTTYLSVK